MNLGPALPCPKCRQALDPLSWQSPDRGTCWSCKVEFQFAGFPALTARKIHATPKAVLMAEHATCFFHAENQAETPCESCGRFLCAVCAVDFAGQRLCPTCITAGKSRDDRAIGERTLYDGIALALAFLPMLMWPITLLTAPVTLGTVVVGWRKPRSLVGGGSRTKIIFAGLLALVQVAAWVSVGTYLALRKR